jgi:hypothetical protein
MHCEAKVGLVQIFIKIRTIHTIIAQNPGLEVKKHCVDSGLARGDDIPVPLGRIRVQSLCDDQTREINHKSLQNPTKRDLLTALYINHHDQQQREQKHPIQIPNPADMVHGITKNHNILTNFDKFLTEHDPDPIPILHGQTQTLHPP